MRNQKEIKHKTLSIRFDLSTYKQLKKLAKEEGRSLGAQTRLFVEKGLIKNGINRQAE